MSKNDSKKEKLGKKRVTVKTGDEFIRESSTVEIVGPVEVCSNVIIVAPVTLRPGVA